MPNPTAPEKPPFELFSYAFRPMFALLALYGVAAIFLWTGLWFGTWQLPLSLSPTAWHAHEMVFGFAGAAIAGFALTAVATWTQRPPVSGTPLIVLSLLWLLPRCTIVTPLPLWVTAVLDLGYNLTLLVLMAREVIGAGNRRNYKMLWLLLGLLIANAAFYLALWRGEQGVREAWLAGLWLVIMAVNLIGGRIIPAFTGNWLRMQAKLANREPGALPPPFGRLDLAAVVSTGLYAVINLFTDPNPAAAVLALLAGLLQFLRLIRWQGLRTTSEPLVWVLHLGFLWLPLGLWLLAGAEMGWLAASAGIHALTIGVIATLIVAVSSRAALGHTNRELKAGSGMPVAYILLSVSALARVLAAAMPAVPLLLSVSSAAWLLAFSIYAVVYWPILTRAAPGQPLPLFKR